MATRRKFLAAGFGLILAAGGGTAFVLWGDRGIPVRTLGLRRAEMLVTLSSTATGAVQSEAEVNVRAEVAGRVARVLVDEGSRVRRGQLLLLLDREEAEANLALARANLAAARSRLSQAEAGVAMLDTQIRTKIAEASATRERARKDLERLRALFGEGAIPRQQLDLAQAEYEVAEAALEAARANQDQMAVKEQEVAAARATLQQMEAQVKLAEVQLARTVIRSPIDGLVTRKFVSAGETLGLGGGTTITLGGPLFTLVDTGRLYASGTIDEVDAARLRVGQEARVTVDAYPGRTFRGRVYKIASSVSGERQEARTVAIRVAVDEARDLLMPGMSADVEVIVAELSEALAIPTQAILEREGEKQIYVVEGNRARLRRVKVRESNWNQTEIVEGLREGDVVILNPDVPGLREDARVRTKP